MLLVEHILPAARNRLVTIGDDAPLLQAASIPNNDLLGSMIDKSERSLLGELLHHRGLLNIIASV